MVPNHQPDIYSKCKDQDDQVLTPLDPRKYPKNRMDDFKIISHYICRLDYIAMFHAEIPKFPGPKKRSVSESLRASQKQSNLLILQRAQFQISSPEMWKGDLTSPKMDQNVGFHPQKWWLNPPKKWLWTTKMVNYTTKMSIQWATLICANRS